MKLTFLGTAGDLASCIQGRRQSGGVMVTFRDEQIHVDPGPGAMVNLVSYKLLPSKTSSIVLSSKELLHTNDVYLACATGKVETVFLPTNVREHIKSELLSGTSIDTAANTVQLRNCRVTTEYNGVASQVFIETPHTRVLYCSEGLPYCQDEVDIFVVGVGARGIPEEHLIDVLRTVNAKITVLNRCASTIHPDDFMVLARDAQRSLDRDVIAAHDGMVLKPEGANTYYSY